MDKLEFPVATCPYCKIRGPVILADMAVVLEDDDYLGTQAIVCPECVKILNTHDDIEIEWFDIDDAKYFGYKVNVDGADGTE